MQGIKRESSGGEAIIKEPNKLTEDDVKLPEEAKTKPDTTTAKRKYNNSLDKDCLIEDQVEEEDRKPKTRITKTTNATRQ